MAGGPKFVLQKYPGGQLASDVQVPVFTAPFGLHTPPVGLELSPAHTLPPIPPQVQESGAPVQICAQVPLASARHPDGQVHWPFTHVPEQQTPLQTWLVGQQKPFTQV